MERNLDRVGVKKRMARSINLSGWERLKTTHPEKSLTVMCRSFRVRFYFVGYGAESNFQFAKRYYEMFEPVEQNGSVDFEVIYSSPHGEFSSPMSPVWSDPEPVLEEENYNGDKVVVERDFALKVAEGDVSYKVNGPLLYMGATDSLDNLLNRIFMESYSSSSTILLHSVTIEHEGEAIVFFGPSGVGKSTLGKFVQDQYGLRVIGTDQVYLTKGEKGELLAQACPNNNPDIPRSPENWCVEARPVKALIHLVRKEDLFYEAAEPKSIFPYFIAESISAPRSEKGCSEYLDLARDILALSEVKLGRFGYPKGKDFLNFLVEQWRQ